MDQRRQWWEELFQIHEYNQFAGAADELTSAEVAFLVEALGLAPGSSVLDLGCGNGRHVLGLARLGIRAEGLEIAENVVGYAQELAARAGLGARFIQGDMRDLAGLGPYDAILMMNSSFGFFSDGENERLLASIADSLVPGGKLLLQTINPYQIVTYLTGYRTGWHRVGAGYILRQARFDPLQGALLAEYIYLDPRQNLELQHPGERIRTYTYPELRAMLQAAGFELAAVFGDAVLPAQPFEETSLWQVMVARKQRP
ncbi:MAG: type 11 methyltransferase [Herpetosiphonaceae bacterium]|nr:MAG: type 11 methyltransferase [Herpetosiphonaceae bacterium]